MLMYTWLFNPLTFKYDPPWLAVSKPIHHTLAHWHTRTLQHTLVIFLFFEQRFSQATKCTAEATLSRFLQQYRAIFCGEYVVGICTMRVHKTIQVLCTELLAFANFSQFITAEQINYKKQQKKNHFAHYIMFSSLRQLHTVKRTY